MNTSGCPFPDIVGRIGIHFSTFAAVAALLALAAALACWIPVRRAAKVDPLATLRAE